MNTDQKDSTRDDCAGVSLGVYNCGGDKLPVFYNCRGDDEIIRAEGCGTVRQRGSVGNSAGAVAIHSVSTRQRTGYKSSCSSC